MCILSNYTSVGLPEQEVNGVNRRSFLSKVLANNEILRKFEQAIHVANIEPYRATTHNQGYLMELML